MSNQKRSIGHIKKLADGKYLLRLSLGFDDYGTRLQPSKVVECKNDREAEIALMEFYADKEKHLEEKQNKAPETLKEMYEEWLKNHVERNLAPRTKEYYESLWKHIDSKGRVKLKALNPKIIYDIIDSVQKGERTVNGVFKMLKAILNKAVKWGYIRENPCSRVETPKYKAKEQKTLVGANLQAIADIILKEDLKYQAIFYLAAVCGLRCQEIVALKWEDIDFKNRTIRIERAATKTKEKGTFIKETKTDKSARVLHMPNILYGLLKKIEKEQKAIRLKLGNKWIDGGWVFTQWNGRIMGVSTPSNWWCEFRDAHADIIPDVTFHGLRHTAATLMLQNGVPLTDVSSVLGHSLKSTTLNIYSHVIEDTKKKAINASANAFTKKVKQ